jgi:transcriptional regulator with XRE-family HTH domain
VNNIKYLREIRGFTQHKLAELLGINQSTVAMWETGESMPRAALLPKIAEILNCTIDDLFKEVKEVG